jgi:hypothetical protein
MRQGQGLGQLNSKNISHISSLYLRADGRKQALEETRFFFSWLGTKLLLSNIGKLNSGMPVVGAPMKKMLPHAQSYFI